MIYNLWPILLNFAGRSLNLTYLILNTPFKKFHFYI